MQERTKQKQKRVEDMTTCLYKCLRAFGLQHHFARFTLMGVYQATQLSGLVMEDYPLLGVYSMEDRTRLFHLVQLVKSLDHNGLAHDKPMIYKEYVHDGPKQFCPAMTGNFSLHDSEDPLEDLSKDQKYNVSVTNSFEPVDFNKMPFISRGDSAHVHASHDRNDEPIHRKGSATPLQYGNRRKKAALHGLRENKDCKINGHSASHDCHNVDEIKPAITGQASGFNSDLSSQPNREQCHNLNLHPAIFKSKMFEKKNGERPIEKGSCSPDVIKPIPVYEARRSAGYNYGLPLSPSSAPNKKRIARQQVIVCVRKRPLTHAECKRGDADVVTTTRKECVIVRESKETVDLTDYILQHSFYFDNVFGEDSSNEEVYQKAAYPLVLHMLSGGKATCLAYGQTGAGKTYTMLGSPPGEPGLYALAVRDIFAHLSATQTYTPRLVYVSFFEIYCGRLYDLLDHRKRLFAREDGEKVVHISGLHNVRVHSVSSLLEVISRGSAERTQGTSGVNPLSSRSHGLLQIQLRDPAQQMSGRMWFVDLAGSERASDTKDPDRQSRMEGAEINQSLLALKECIRSLDKEEIHTPFRQSKLTQVLKDSFVGNSMTCMIANISPGQRATEHTLNTLRYADRVKELRRQKGPSGIRGCKIGLSNPRKQPNGKRSMQSTAAFSKRINVCKHLKKTPRTRLHTFLSSTPQNSICVEETYSRGREDIGFGDISPVQGQLASGDGGWLSKGSWRGTKPESGINHEGKEIHQYSVKGRIKEAETKRQVESFSDKSSAVMEQKKAEDQEKMRHLRQYHQQLQQFVPSSTSSPTQRLSVSTCPSLSCSQGVHSSRLQSTGISVFSHEDHELEAILNTQNEKYHPNSEDEVWRGESCGCEKWIQVEERGKINGDVTGLDTMCAWKPAAEEVVPTNTEPRLSFRCDFNNGEGINVENLHHGVWRRPYEFNILSSAQMNDNILFHPSFKSPRLRAGAERAFSAACKHNNNDPPQDGPSVCSLNCSTDPLSISQLQVEQQAASASVLQEEQSNTKEGLFRSETVKEFPSSVQMEMELVKERQVEPPPVKRPPLIASAASHALGAEDIKQQNSPTLYQPSPKTLDYTKYFAFETHLERVKELEALCDKVGMLRCQECDLVFGEYVHKLEEILEMKARCVRFRGAQLQPFLKPKPSNR